MTISVRFNQHRTSSSADRKTGGQSGPSCAVIGRPMDMQNDSRRFGVINVSPQTRPSCPLACEVGARAVVVYADAVEGDQEFQQLLRMPTIRTILFSRSRHAPAISEPEGPAWIRVPDVHMTRTGLARIALLLSLPKACCAMGTASSSSRAWTDRESRGHGHGPRPRNRAGAIPRYREPELRGDILPRLSSACCGSRRSWALKGARTTRGHHLRARRRRTCPRTEPAKVVLSPFHGYSRIRA